MRALVRDRTERGRRASRRRASRWSSAICAIRAALKRATGGVDVVYHIAAIYRQAGLPAETYRAVNATAVRRPHRGGGRERASAASCTAARSACTATSSIRRRTKTRRSGPGDIYQETKLEGERLAREAGERLGIEVTIVRPTGIYGPGDRRLLKLFRGVARRRWSRSAAAKSTTISPTSTIWSKASGCAASTRRRPTAPTSSPAGK